LKNPNTFFNEKKDIVNEKSIFEEKISPKVYWFAMISMLILFSVLIYISIPKISIDDRFFNSEISYSEIREIEMKKELVNYNNNLYQTELEMKKNSE